MAKRAAVSAEWSGVTRAPRRARRRRVRSTPCRLYAPWTLILTPWGIYETSLGFLEPFTGGGCKIWNEHADKPQILLSALKLHHQGPWWDWERRRFWVGSKTWPLNGQTDVIIVNLWCGAVEKNLLAIPPSAHLRCSVRLLVQPKHHKVRVNANY